MDDDKVETVFPLPWWFAVAVAVLTSLPGCATPPPCERFGYNVVHDQDGQPLVLFDMENVDKLIGLIKGLAAGECRLPVDGEV